MELLSFSGKQGFDCGEITLRAFICAIGLEGPLVFQTLESKLTTPNHGHQYDNNDNNAAHGLSLPLDCRYVSNVIPAFCTSPYGNNQTRDSSWRSTT
jgi:hypothetical protein